MYASASAGLADHWIDGLVAALLATLGYFGNRELDRLNERCQALEEELKEARTDVYHLTDRLARIEGSLSKHLQRT